MTFLRFPFCEDPTYSKTNVLGKLGGGEGLVANHSKPTKEAM